MASVRCCNDRRSCLRLPRFESVLSNLHTDTYPRSKADMACAFVERDVSLMAPGARVGVLMTRTSFFFSSFDKWRTDGVIMRESLQLLGYGVLGAGIETCAYVLQPEVIIGE